MALYACEHCGRPLSNPAALCPFCAEDSAPPVPPASIARIPNADYEPTVQPVRRPAPTVVSGLHVEAPDLSSMGTQMQRKLLPLSGGALLVLALIIGSTLFDHGKDAQRAPAGGTTQATPAAVQRGNKPSASAAVPDVSARSDEFVIPDVEPKVRHAPAPGYPPSAYREGIEGTVILQITVTPTGGPGNIEIHKTSGNAALDRAAIRAARNWRFDPAYQNGEPVRAVVRIPVKFQL